MFSPFSRRDRRPSLISRSRQPLPPCRPLVELLEERDVPSIIVTNTGDADGTGSTGNMSLRQAINRANTTESLEPVVIDFNIPGTAGQVFTITPQSALPALENTIEIDGTSQTTFNGGTVVLNGVALNDGQPGLEIDASNCTVQGLVINGFASSAAILIAGESSNDLIQNNFIGTDAAGSTAVSNFYGVAVNGADNTISGNVISGNTGDGILLDGLSANDNLVSGNFIGTDVAGLNALPNGDGIQIDGGASQNTIGGATTATGPLSAPGNLISGNVSNGIEIDGQSRFFDSEGNSSQNVILGNFIGTDISGDVPLGDGADGILLNNSANNVIGSGNVIAGNAGDGVLIQADYFVQVNADSGFYAGPDISGPVFIPSGAILLPSLGDNIVANNFIGTDQSATLALGNGGDGVGVDGSDGNSIVGNAVFDNGGQAINLLDNGNDSQAAPQITGATYDGSTLTISWSLNSSATATTPFRIEFFASSVPGSATSGEGQQFLGFASTVTDSNGQATGTITFSNVTLVGPYLTATATVVPPPVRSLPPVEVNEDNPPPTFNGPFNTSEFSLPFVVAIPVPPPPVVPIPPPPSGSAPVPVVASDSSPPVAIVFVPIVPIVPVPVPAPPAGPTFDPSAISEFFAAEALAGHHEVKDLILLPQGQSETFVFETFLPAKIHSTDMLVIEVTSRANTTCTITGVIFQDTNGDGVREGNEPPLEGMCVYLERIDGGDTGGPVPVAYTDNNGQYKFEGLAPGAYVVRPMKHRLYRVSAPQTGFERVHLQPEGSATVPFGCKPQKKQTDGDPDSDARPLRRRDRLMEARDALFTSEAAPWWSGLALAGAFVGGVRRRREREER